jgi:hypothetical protein
MGKQKRGRYGDGCVYRRKRASASFGYPGTRCISWRVTQNDPGGVPRGMGECGTVYLADGNRKDRVGGDRTRVFTYVVHYSLNRMSVAPPQTDVWGGVVRGDFQKAFLKHPTKVWKSRLSGEIGPQFTGTFHPISRELFLSRTILSRHFVAGRAIRWKVPANSL